MDELLSKKCIPCSISTDPFGPEEIDEYIKKVDGEWQAKEGRYIERSFKFKDFKEALDFTNRVGQIAEEEGHHPDIFLAWGRVKVKLMTHNIKGLHENDFIMAAKIDQLN